MIRRKRMWSERDPRGVKWSLIAAAFALSVGAYADHVVSAQTEAQAEREAANLLGEVPAVEPVATIAG